MRSIETIGEVTEDGKIVAPAPPDIAPGRRRMIIVVDTEASLVGAPQHIDLPAWEWDGWPADCRFSREDLYDDAER